MAAAAGRFQFELETAALTRNGGDSSYGLGELNAKYGLEGGIIVPFGFQGPGGWGFGVQAELDVVADDAGSGHHFSFLTSATAAHALTEKTGVFFELVAIFSEGSEATSEYYFNSGLTYGVTDTLQLDGGVRVGLSSDSDDFTPFIGVSEKF